MAIRYGGGSVDRGMVSARFRLAGVAGVVVLWAMLAAAAWRTGFPLLGDRPLSWMVADPASVHLFQAGLVISALLFIAFHGNVRERFPAGSWFSFAMVGGMAAQMVTAVVPIDGGGASYRIHTVAALALGASLPLLMWRFAVGQTPGPWRRLAHGLLWAEVAACAVGVALSRSSVAPLAEIVPAAAFHVWVLTLTFAPAPALAVAADAASGRRSRPADPPARPATAARRRGAAPEIVPRS